MFIRHQNNEHCRAQYFTFTARKMYQLSDGNHKYKCQIFSKLQKKVVTYTSLSQMYLGLKHITFHTKNISITLMSVSKKLLKKNFYMTTKKKMSYVKVLYILST